MSTTCGSESELQRKPAPPALASRFPEDIRAWVAGPALLLVAQRIAQEHTASALHPVFSLSAPRFHHPWRMLTLLIYCYASGIWHARATAEIAALDPSLIELCHGHPPSVEVIRRFRAHNGDSIVRCLERLLRRLWCQRNEGAGTLHPLLIAEICFESKLRLQRAEQSDEGDAAATCARQNFKGG